MEKIFIEGRISRENKKSHQKFDKFYFFVYNIVVTFYLLYYLYDRTRSKVTGI